SVARVVGWIGRSVGSVWIDRVPVPPRTPPPWRGEVADEDDFVEMLETMKPITSIKISIVETIKVSKVKSRIFRCAGHWHPSHRTRHWSALNPYSGNRTWDQSAAHSHLRGRITAHLCLSCRNRDSENACYHAIKENEFSPVHSVIGF